jgi:hypothetical protein
MKWITREKVKVYDALYADCKRRVTDSRTS